MSQWHWLSADVLYAIHDAQLAQHGGVDGIRDKNLIESALARPQQQYRYGDPPPDAAALAAAYAYAIVSNHGFCDGNKRTGWVAARLFLLDNRVSLTFSATDAITAMLALAAGTMTEEAFATWIRNRIGPAT